MKLMDKVNTAGTMASLMRVNGKIIKCVAKES